MPNGPSMLDRPATVALRLSEAETIARLLYDESARLIAAAEAGHAQVRQGPDHLTLRAEATICQELADRIYFGRPGDGLLDPPTLTRIMEATAAAPGRLRYAYEDWRANARYLMERYADETVTVAVLNSKLMNAAADERNDHGLANAIRAYSRQDKLASFVAGFEADRAGAAFGSRQA